MWLEHGGGKRERGVADGDVASVCGAFFQREAGGGCVEDWGAGGGERVEELENFKHLKVNKLNEIIASANITVFYFLFCLCGFYRVFSRRYVYGSTL